MAELLACISRRNSVSEAAALGAHLMSGPRGPAERCKEEPLPENLISRPFLITTNPKPFASLTLSVCFFRLISIHAIFTRDTPTSARHNHERNRTASQSERAGSLGQGSIELSRHAYVSKHEQASFSLRVSPHNCAYTEPEYYASRSLTTSSYMRKSFTQYYCTQASQQLVKTKAYCLIESTHQSARPVTTKADKTSIWWAGFTHMCLSGSVCAWCTIKTIIHCVTNTGPKQVLANLPS